MPKQPVAAGFGLEFLFLVEGELLLKALFALVELRHFLGFQSCQLVRAALVAAARSRAYIMGRFRQNNEPLSRS